MTIRIALSLPVLATLLACSAAAPTVTSASPEGVTVVATSSMTSGFASEQDVRVTAQRACEQFGRNAGPLQQGNATDSQRTFQFSCIER
ncbi:MAG: hypothetical protein QNI90_01455 [Dinoroseobacter sp.]|nr:hypothetical protein [Dinoroseobacter sp.]